MEKTVANLLTGKGSEIWSVGVDSTVLDALREMADKNIGALVVLAGDGGLAGIVSERDYARKVVLFNRDSESTKVAEIMTGDVITVSPTDTVNNCMALMTEHRIRHLPVVDNDRLVGVISIGDVVKGVIAQQATLIDQLERYITG